MNSQYWFQKALMCSVGGVHSPVRAFKHVGQNPIFFEKASGPWLYDVEGREYIDFCMAFGVHLFGHAPSKIIQAIHEQVKKGTNFGATHPHEVELCEIILKAYPFFDRVRLVNTGTEAVMTALRLARGYRNKTKIIKFNGMYHGHVDSLLVKSGSYLASQPEASSLGIPVDVIKDTVVVDFLDMRQLEEVIKREAKDLAAIILEPVPANHGLYIPDAFQLKRMLHLCRSEGILVIFDEVITGFRLGFGGACEYYDIQPDIVLLGKILGGGLPLSAVVSKKEILEQLAPLGPVFQAGTFAGNPLSCASGLETLKEIKASSPYVQLEELTHWFRERLTHLLGKFFAPIQVRSLASLFWVCFDSPTGFPAPMTELSLKTYAAFFRGALKKGLYFPPSPYEVCFLSTAHSREVLVEALRRLESIQLDE